MISALSLTACAAGRSEPPAPIAAPPSQIVNPAAGIVVPSYSPDLLRRVADEKDAAVAAGEAWPVLIADYGRMRDAVRAAQGRTAYAPQ
jgi:hypothetical protein